MSLWDQLYAKMVKLGLQDAHVNVGVLGGGEIADIAAIHEFGAPGAGIIKRSFIRFTMKDREKDIAKVLTKVGTAVLKDTMTVERALDVLGLWVQGAIKRSITKKLIVQQLKPGTIAAKGSTTALLDTGQLMNAITWKVVK